jgi:hypothetical protein
MDRDAGGYRMHGDAHARRCVCVCVCVCVCACVCVCVCRPRVRARVHRVVLLVQVVGELLLHVLEAGELTPHHRQQRVGKEQRVRALLLRLVVLEHLAVWHADGERPHAGASCKRVTQARHAGMVRASGMPAWQHRGLVQAEERCAVGGGTARCGRRRGGVGGAARAYTTSSLGPCPSAAAAHPPSSARASTRHTAWRTSA